MKISEAHASSVGYLVWKLHNAARGLLMERLEQVDLTLAQMAALSALHNQPSLSTADLARELCLTPQNLSLVVARLERDGFVERRPDEVHGRIQRIEITARGRSIMNKGIERAKAVDEDMLAGFNMSERTSLPKMLLRCLKSLDTGRSDGDCMGARKQTADWRMKTKAKKSRT